MAKITQDSHVDHNLTPEQMEYVARTIADYIGFKILTVEMPAALGSVPCGLHGPATGGAPVSESEVYYRVRGNRPGPTRMVARPAVQSSKLTMIVGPHNGETILFTAYGGPLAPREPFDAGLTDDASREESRRFWSEHALGM